MMKCLMILLELCLIACNGQSVKQEEKTDSDTPKGNWKKALKFQTVR